MAITYNLSQIDRAVDFLLENAPHKTLLFYGEMGAGKTTLIREFVRKLGAKDVAQSPTFALVNEYEAANGRVFHFDFYRIEDETEALDMGLEDYLATEAWKLIEWPERIENLLDDEVSKIEIEIVDEHTRKLKFC